MQSIKSNKEEKKYSKALKYIQNSAKIELQKYVFKSKQKLF